MISFQNTSNYSYFRSFQNKSSINCLRLSLALLIDLTGIGISLSGRVRATSIFFEILVIPCKKDHI